MRPRKLLSSKALTTLEVKVTAGIPLALAMRQMDINMSRPAVAKLLSWLKQGDNDHHNPESTLALRLNLFPEWLDADSLTPQEQPSNWVYQGNFPTGGCWLCLR